MFSLALELLADSLVPRVENPWPDTIGLELPVSLAAAFAIVAGVVKVRASKVDRDQAINRAGVAGLLLGTVIYLIALVIQIGSTL